MNRLLIGWEYALAELLEFVRCRRSYQPNRRFLYRYRPIASAPFFHTDFCITHCRCAVAVNRTEVTLSIYQGVTHREILRHTHDSIVNSRVTMRVVFTDYVTHHTGRFLIRLVPVVV